MERGRGRRSAAGGLGVLSLADLAHEISRKTSGRKEWNSHSTVDEGRSSIVDDSAFGILFIGGLELTRSEKDLESAGIIERDTFQKCFLIIVLASVPVPVVETVCAADVTAS